MKRLVIYTCIFVLLQSSIIFIWIFLNPKPFLEGLLIPAGAFYVPIISLVFTIIFVIIMRKKVLIPYIFLIPIFTIYLFGFVEPYFKYIVHRETDYEFFLSIKYTEHSGYPRFEPTVGSNYYDPQIEEKLMNSIKNEIPKDFVLSRLQADRDEPIIWVEVAKPSFLMGSLSEFAYYDTQINKLSNFVTEQQISKVLKKHGEKVYHFDKKERKISTVIKNDIKGEANLVKVIKIDGQLILN